MIMHTENAVEFKQPEAKTRWNNNKHNQNNKVINNPPHLILISLPAQVVYLH